MSSLFNEVLVTSDQGYKWLLTNWLSLGLIWPAVPRPLTSQSQPFPASIMDEGISCDSGTDAGWSEGENGMWRGSIPAYCPWVWVIPYSSMVVGTFVPQNHTQHPAEKQYGDILTCTNCAQTVCQNHFLFRLSAQELVKFGTKIYCGTSSTHMHADPTVNTHRFSNYPLSSQSRKQELTFSWYNGPAAWVGSDCKIWLYSSSIFHRNESPLCLSKGWRTWSFRRVMGSMLV